MIVEIRLLTKFDYSTTQKSIKFDEDASAESTEITDRARIESSEYNGKLRFSDTGIYCSSFTSSILYTVRH